MLVLAKGMSEDCLFKKPCRVGSYGQFVGSVEFLASSDEHDLEKHFKQFILSRKHKGELEVSQNTLWVLVNGLLIGFPESMHGDVRVWHITSSNSAVGGFSEGTASLFKCSDGLRVK